MQAMRSSSVPSKERAGEAVVDSKAINRHRRAKGIDRSSVLLHLSTFIGETTFLHPSRCSTSSDRHTLLLKFAACSETSAFVAFDPVAARPGKLMRCNSPACDPPILPLASVAHEPPSYRTFVQALRSTPTLTSMLEWRAADKLLAVGDKEMLQGFTAPRSPLGVAAIVPPPPWHFAGDVLAVEFWNDPDISVHVLPAGVELDKKCPGHSVALFADYQFSAQDNEYLDPARYQCRQFTVLLDAMWKGTRIAWCPYCYADNDAALMRGWIQGYPRKFGTVHQTRSFSTAGAASAPLAQDSRFAACMSAHGRLLVQARITLRERAERLVGLLDRRIVGRRYFPRLSAGLHDRPAVDELVCCILNHPLITDIWIGEGELNFPEAYGEELEILGPLKVGRGCRFSFSYSVTDIEILADLTAQHAGRWRLAGSVLRQE